MQATNRITTNIRAAMNDVDKLRYNRRQHIPKNLHPKDPAFIKWNFPDAKIFSGPHFCLFPRNP